MNCNNCGAILTDGDKFCKNCGMPVQNGSGDQNAMGGNPYQNYGQPMQPNYNGMNYPNPPKQGGGAKLALIIILVVLLLGGLCVGGVIFVSKYTKVSTTIGKNKDNGDKKKDKETVEEEDVAKTGQANYKVTHDNYTFEIPGEYVYEDEITSITIGDTENTWLADIEVNLGDFALFKNNIEELKTYLTETNGYTITEPQLKTLSGKEYLVMEATFSGQNAVLAIADGGNGNYMTVVAINESNEIDHTILEEKIAPILATATYSEASAGLNIGTKKKMDLSGLEDIAKGKKATKKK